ncbi:MAG: mechanosensitive ion channel [Gammaproteobacteria bacterium]|nr:mechanosensitive ion channel [Gammaproteobacteria bacterium]
MAAVVALVAMLAGGGATAQAAALDLIGLQRLEQDLREQGKELERATDRLLSENSAASTTLQADEAGLGAEDISVPELRDARFELDSLRSRITTISNRLRQRENGLRRLEEDIQAQQDTVRARAENSLSRVLAEVRLRQLETVREVQQSLVELLDRMRAALVERRALTAERVAMLQARADLTTIEASLDGEDDPRVALIRDVIGTLVRESVRSSNEASQLAGAGGDLARRRLLELQADEALLRAGVRQADIELLGIERRLALVDSLVNDRAVPTRLLVQAERRVTDFAARLDERKDVIESEEQTLVAQKQSLAGRVSGNPQVIDTALRRIGDLQTVLELQAKTVLGLRERVSALDQALKQTLARAQASGLFDRVRLPDDATALHRLGGSLAALPARIGQRWQGIYETLSDRLGATDTRTRALFGALAALALLLVALLRSHLKRFLRRTGSDSLTTIPASALRSTLPWLLPAVLIGAGAVFLGLEREVRNELLVILLTFPAAVFVLRMTWLTFVEGAPEHRVRARRRFYGRLRLAVWAVALVVIAVVLTRYVALSPLAVSLIDRLAFLTFVLIAFPLLQSRSLVMSLYGEQLARSSASTNVLSWASLLVPLTLAACGIIGLSGYVNLAWAVATHIGWLSVVGSALLVVIAILRGTFHAHESRYRMANPLDSEFWLANFYRPLYRLTIVGLYVLAGYVLLELYGWDRNTPWVSAVLNVIGMRLFSLGNADFTLASLVTAVVLIWLAFWVGGWSRQVTYNVAFSRIRDAGIRASLSVFTQYVVVVLGLLIALQVIGLDLTALAVFAGALGVGIGFGLQNITNNFLSGVLLLAERPLRVSDIVTVGDHMGEVTRIGIRSLTVKTYDQQEVIIPNSEVISESFINWTRSDDISRELLMIGISYDNEPDDAIAIISEIVNGYEPVLQTPKPLVTLFEFADSAVIIRLHYFVNMRGSVGKLAVRSEVLRRIWQRFAEQGITIPYPQQDVHLNIARNESLGRLLQAPAGGTAGPQQDSPMAAG